MATTTAKAAKGVMVFTADAIGLLRDIQERVYRQVRQKALARAAADKRELVTADDIAAVVEQVLGELMWDVSRPTTLGGENLGMHITVHEATVGQSDAVLHIKAGPDEPLAGKRSNLPISGAPNAAADDLSRDR